MAKKYWVHPILNSVNGFGLQFTDSNLIFNIAHPGGANKTLTIPGIGASGTLLNSSNAFVAIFSYGVDAEVWVNLNAAAAVPVGVAFANGSELNPEARYVKAGDVINVNSTAAVKMSITLYPIPNH